MGSRYTDTTILRPRIESELVLAMVLYRLERIQSQLIFTVLASSGLELKLARSCRSIWSPRLSEGKASVLHMQSFRLMSLLHNMPEQFSFLQRY